MMSVVDSEFSPTMVDSLCNSTSGLIAFTLDMLLQRSPNGIPLSLGHLPASSFCLRNNFACLFSHHQITTIIRMTNKNPTMVGPAIIARRSYSQLGLVLPTRSSLDFNSSKLILSRGFNKSGIFSKETSGNPFIMSSHNSIYLLVLVDNHFKKDSFASNFSSV